MFLVKVDGIDGYFQTKTGGDVQSQTTRVYDGGSKQSDVIAAPPEVANVAVSRTFDPARDAQVIRDMRRLVGSWVTTVSVTPTDADFVAVDQPVVYPASILVGVKEYEVNSSSGDPATYELEFACPDVR
jgi:hypothetical protein